MEPLVADRGLRRVVRGYIAEIRRLARSRVPRRPDRPRKVLCGCGHPLPHLPYRKVPLAGPERLRRRAVWVRHFRVYLSRRAHQARWSRLDPEARRAATAAASAARRRQREELWLARLDPRVVHALGRRQALQEYIRRHNARVRPSKRILEISS